MEAVSQGDETLAHVTIRGVDGETIHNVWRTVRNVENDGITKSGVAKVDGRDWNVFWSRQESKWIGPMYAQGLNL